MVKRFLRAVVVGALLALTCLVVPTLVSPALASSRHQAASPNDTTLPGFAGIVADRVHDRVFISGGKSNKLTVTDGSGALVTTISGLPRPEGMVLSPDSSTLFVALRDDDSVLAVDTVNLTSTRLEIGSRSCPETLAFVSGLLWYGYGCSALDASIGAIDVTSGDVFPALGGDLSYYYAPTLAADPTVLPDVLFAADAESSGSELRLLTVTGLPTPKLALAAQRILNEPPGQMVVTDDGQGVVVAASQQFQVDVLSTADLGVLHSYRTGVNPNSVATGPDGLLAIGLDGTEPDVSLYRPGQDTPFRTISLPGEALLYAGLAFGDSSIFAVTGTSRSDATLNVLDPRRVTRLSIKADRTGYAYGAVAFVTAHLGTTATNRTVSIYVTPYGGEPRLLKKARVDAQGDLVAHAMVFKRSTFTAVFDGDEDSQPVQADIAPPVHARVTNSLRGWYSSAGAYHLYHVTTNPRLSATIAPNEAGECAYAHAELLTDGAWRTIALSPCLVLDSHSHLVVALGPPHHVGERLRLRAEWRTHPDSAVSFGAWQYARITS